MAHVRWHATVSLSWFLGLFQDPNASHENTYTCPGSQCFTCKTLCCKSLHWGSLLTIPTILYACPGSDASHSKSLALYRFPTIQIIPYARAASQQLQHFLMRVQAPKASHSNPYAWAGSQKFKHFLTPGKASNNSHVNPYAWKGSQSFTLTSLCLYRFPTIQTIPYAWAASQKFLTQLRLIACDHRRGSDS
ncbi:hypothetical protein O181_014793 [Austropuccinia psidii MF-1]|uniref:Secreted protein n=1 Tax=Austropuccinia psidii MF-1 TaxID=1389203 RepID=A0A9Q3C1W8_9BASI|nr:hypothetical protein [Austropuccinia psidii MF-1]